MYLKGLGDPYVAFPPNIKADAFRCEQAGGYPEFRYAAYDANRVGIPATATVNCRMPTRPQKQPKAAPAKITVKVPTRVTTQVNPTISPNVIQQDQPQGSPVSTNVAPSATQDNSDALLDWMRGQPSNPVPTSAFVPADPAPGTVAAQSGGGSQSGMLIGLAAVAGLFMLLNRR